MSDTSSISFNEAPALLPGEGGSGMCGCFSRTTRFNEAPALLPGETAYVKLMPNGDMALL